MALELRLPVYIYDYDKLNRYLKEYEGQDLWAGGEVTFQLTGEKITGRKFPSLEELLKQAWTSETKDEVLKPWLIHGTVALWGDFPVVQLPDGRKIKCYVKGYLVHEEGILHLEKEG